MANPGKCRWCGCAGDSCTLADGDRCCWATAERDCCTAPGCQREEFNTARRTRRKGERDVKTLKVKVLSSVIDARKKREQAERKRRAKLKGRAR